jgi:hypothetical protein
MERRVTWGIPHPDIRREKLHTFVRVKCPLQPKLEMCQQILFELYIIKFHGKLPERVNN